MTNRTKLRAVLVYPPGEQKISEPIPPPNMTIAVLARALTEAGYEAAQLDAERAWFGGVQKMFGPRRLELIYDHKKVAAYVNGRAPAKLKAAYDGICRDLLRGLELGRTDVLGVTLVDIRAEPLIINFSALLCHAAKAKYGARTVLGYRGMPKEAYFQLMRRYRCFDYGVYANWGEKALLAIMDEAAGRKTALVGTVARRGRRLVNYGGAAERRPYAPAPLYDGKILDGYRATGRDILSRYNSDFPFVKKLLTGQKKYLVAPYVFELTCPGACAFCENDNRLPSDVKSADQVIDELSALKERGVTGIYFVNSSFNNHYKLAEEICDKMVKYKLGLKWFDCANLRVVDERLLDKMKAAGAVKLTFGVETGSQRLLNYVNKGITRERAMKYLAYSDKIGIWNHIELIAGFPTERPEDVASTLEFMDVIRPHVDLYTLNPFYLYPNSRFYREQARFGVKVRPYPPMQLMNFFYPRYRIVEQYSVKFDETGGLKWEEKNREIVRSVKALAGKIDSTATYRAIGNEHVYLMNFLYDRLGHARKELIRKLVKVLTVRFKPYNLDFFMEDFSNSFSKQDDMRIFAPLKGTEFLGEAK